jgi:hypothetical protein
MQTAPPLLKKGTFGTILDIATKEGPRGFYSGVSPTNCEVAYSAILITDAAFSWHAQAM